MVQPISPDEATRLEGLRQADTWLKVFILWQGWIVELELTSGRVVSGELRCGIGDDYVNVNPEVQTGFPDFVPIAHIVRLRVIGHPNNRPGRPKDAVTKK